MENWQIGRRSDNGIKLVDFRPENIVELLRAVIAHHTLDRCLTLQHEGCCPEIDKAASFLFEWDKYHKRHLLLEKKP
jgi:hypothetical protein